jgi:uncharacterized protein (DUF849 family)
VTPAEIAEAAEASLRAGADDLHVHPKDPTGKDSIDPEIVAAVLVALRERCGNVPVGITTGAWTGSGDDRCGHVRSWTVLPDHVSVNFHEQGAEQLARRCLDRGIAVDAGIWSHTDGLERLVASGLASSCRHLLLEVTDADVDAALVSAEELINLAAPLARPLLLHGEETSAWPLLALAARRGLAARMGLEDTLLLPDGSSANDNAELVSIAHRECRASR